MYLHRVSEMMQLIFVNKRHQTYHYRHGTIAAHNIRITCEINLRTPIRPIFLQETYHPLSPTLITVRNRLPSHERAEKRKPMHCSQPG